MIEKIVDKILNKEKINSKELTLLLDYLINRTKEIINSKTYENTCDLAQGLIGRYLNSLKVINFPNLSIKAISEGVVGHSFIVADFKEFGQDLYLLDPTFVQFAILDQKYQELYIKDLKVLTKSPYYYANLLNKELTNALLTKGYLKLDPKSAKFYGDSFLYTKTNILKGYQFPNIKGEIYLNSFLKGQEKLQDYGYEEIDLKDSDTIANKKM